LAGAWRWRLRRLAGGRSSPGNAPRARRWDAISSRGERSE
jgi:hypothetical protein